MSLLDLFRRKKTPAPAAATPQQQFADEVRARIAARPEVTAVSPLAEEYGLEVRRGEDVSRLYLDNLFAETRELEPQERDLLIERFLTVLEVRETDEPWEQVRPRLRAVLRPAFSTAAELDAHNPLVAEPVAPALRAHLVVDEPTSMRYVAEDAVRRWGVSGAEALLIGRQNLAQLPQQRLALYDERPVKLWHLDADDDYEVARVLAPGFLGSLRDLVEGAPVLIFPTRSLLFVAGDADPAAIKRLCELAEREYLASPRSISFALYTVSDDDRLIPYLGAEAAKAAHAKFLAAEYTRQQEELEALFARRGVDRFVAGFKLLELKDGRTVSFATWSFGVDGLLPEAELIVVRGRTEKTVHFVPWAQAVRIAGPLLIPEPRLFPTRWRTAAEVPEPVQEALAAAAVEL